MHVSGAVLTLYQQTITGSRLGSANPQHDIVTLLRRDDAGRIKLDELVTGRYTLEEVNEGYQGRRDGKNSRGMMVHSQRTGSRTSLLRQRENPAGDVRATRSGTLRSPVRER